MKARFFVWGLFLLGNMLWVSATYAQTLKLGTDDWPPYEFEQNGNITGYSTEIIQAVFQHMDVEIAELKIYPWTRAERLVFNGIIDVLYSSSTGEERLKYCYFPEEPLIESPWVLFIKKENEGKLRFDSLEDLKGKQIGVVADYSYTPEFWEFLKQAQNYDEVPTDQQNFQKLVRGRIDYLVSEYAVGISIAKDLGINDQVVALTDHPIKTTGLYIMFSKKTINQEFVQQFSDQLKQFKTTPEYQAIYDKYLK